jgi:hypothetical protein
VLLDVEDAKRCSSDMRPSSKKAQDGGGPSQSGYWLKRTSHHLTTRELVGLWHTARTMEVTLQRKEFDQKDASGQPKKMNKTTDKDAGKTKTIKKADDEKIDKKPADKTPKQKTPLELAIGKANKIKTDYLAVGASAQMIMGRISTDDAWQHARKDGKEDALKKLFTDFESGLNPFASKYMLCDRKEVTKKFDQDTIIDECNNMVQLRNAISDIDKMCKKILDVHDAEMSA